MPLAATLGGPGARISDALFAPQAQDLLRSPRFIRYDSSCFTINDRDTFIFSAAFHYPRCPRPLWGDRMLKLQRAGFNTIETCVFWNYHEPEEGRSDLSEFEAFVQLAGEMGFWMIVRPGPYICAEWERGGFPRWVAVKRFPLRSNHPESVKSSQHWFGQVLPVVQRHLVTRSGPIILVQLENEYDYWTPVPEAEKREYLRALYRMARNAGIDVPLITCWTKPARENSDPDMARILDTCNFYPRWNIAKEVPPALQKLRQEEPKSPLSVTELQGGWFSQFGGKPSVEQDGVDGAQLNLLTKTVIEHGVTYFNIYMGFGGTNFDWAAKTLTTTYDYAAPIREPGGLWEKYYAARGICQALRIFGSVLTRAQRLEGVTQSTNEAVSVTERASGPSAVVFVRENSNAEQRFKMTFQDPASPTHRAIAVPREGELSIGPREMKMLPVQIPIPGGTLRYSTAEVLAHGLLLDRHLLIVYEEPGRLVEISLATSKEPRVEGDALYQYWDPEFESVIIGIRLEKEEKFLLVNGHLLVVVVPRHRALRSWPAEFSPSVVPAVEETRPMLVTFITDSALLASTGSSRKRIWADLDFLPGEHDISVLLPPLAGKCRVDGTLVDFEYERALRRARLRATTPPLPSQPVVIRDVRAWVEKFDPGLGQWLSSAARPLEELGPVPYGYVKYRADFSSNSQTRMLISTYADDAKKVFLNGKVVAEASNSEKRVEFSLSAYARPGTNTIEISYELFGSPNFGDNLGELKGVESARLKGGPGGESAVDAWQVQRFPAPARGREIDPAFSPEFSKSGWTSASLEGSPQSDELVPAFTWCRAEFSLEMPPEGWSVPWKLTLEAGRDALLYLNGKFVGRHVTAGPQKDFYLPDPYLLFDPRRKNVLHVVLAYTDDPRHIRALRVAPYDEFSTKRTRVEFEW